MSSRDADITDLHRLLHHHRVQHLGRWRADALVALIPRLASLAFVSHFLAAARAIESPWGRGRVLAALVPFVSPDTHEAVIDEILTTARRIEQPRGRIEVSAAVIPFLFKQHQLILVEEICQTARASLDLATIETAPPRALADYAQRLAAVGYIDAALSLIGAIPHEAAQGDALATIAPYLTSTLLPQALRFARSLMDSRSRNTSLSGLSLKLAEEGYLADALSAARDIEYALCRAWALAALVPFADWTQRDEVVQEALATARVANDLRSTAGVLFSSLSEAQQADLLPEALEHTLSVQTSLWRTRGLIGLLKQLPHTLHHEVVPIALERARTIDVIEWRAEAMALLLPFARGILDDEALESARAIQNDERRVDALLRLLPEVPEQRQEAIIGEVLPRIQASTSVGWCIGALIKLLPSVDDLMRRTLLERAFALTAEDGTMGWQAMSIAGLAPGFLTTCSSMPFT